MRGSSGWRRPRCDEAWAGLRASPRATDALPSVQLISAAMALVIVASRRRRWTASELSCYVRQRGGELDTRAAERLLEAMTRLRLARRLADGTYIADIGLHEM